MCNNKKISVFDISLGEIEKKIKTFSRKSFLPTK